MIKLIAKKKFNEIEGKLRFAFEDVKTKYEQNEFVSEYQIS
jgi:hypothetical protein